MYVYQRASVKTLLFYPQSISTYILIILPQKISKYGEMIGKTHFFTQKYGEDSPSKA
jgi:hypothetical protein